MDSYDDWSKKGSEDVMVRANRKYKQMLEECPTRSLAEDIDRELAGYISSAIK
jgi:trimethylamine--corrinoid protein Co-methyltransferase